MDKTVFMFCLIVFSLIANGTCHPPKVDCTKIPIENLKPCESFLSGKGTLVDKPTLECCKGAQSWLAAPPAVVCKCYKKSPNRLPYKPDKVRTLALPFECGIPEFYNYVPCLTSGH